MMFQEANIIETAHTTPAEETKPELYAQKAVAPDVEAAVRLFSDKRLRTRKGAVVWLWTASAPVTAWLTFLSFVNGDFDWMTVNALALATALRLNRLAAEVDSTQVVLRTDLDTSWTGALVDALEWPHRRIRAIARAYLIHLLPKLTEADAELLDEAQRDSLYSLLSPRAAVKNPPLTFAILQALNKIGDAEAVPHVVRLARMVAYRSRAVLIRQAARECLPALERRVLAQRMTETTVQESPQLSIEHDPVSAPEQRLMDGQVLHKLKQLEAEARKAQPGMRLGFLMASYGIILPYMLYQTSVGFVNRNLLHTMLFGLLALGTSQMHRLTLNAKHRAMAKFLAEQNSVEAIGPLAEALEWPDTYIRHVAIKALSQLLPQMRASDASLLTPRQRLALYRMLAMKHARTHSTFIVILLKALEQVGDQAALPFVEALTRSRPLTSQQKKVYDAAVACMPYLQEQAKQDQYSQTLLRAASVENVPSESLLRPAFGSPAAEAASLLRAEVGERRDTP